MGFPSTDEADSADDHDAMREEVLAAAKELLSLHRNVKAIVMECTNLPPFSHAVEKETGVGVWDILTLGSWLYRGAVPRNYS